jgi:predicted phosphodiesterase
MGDVFLLTLIAMRILVISDVHANLSALQAVIQDAGNVDATWCLGDIVGYGPDPNECIEIIRSIPNLTCLIGNHDAALLDQISIGAFNREARLSIHWLRDVLKDENRAFLQSLKDNVVVEGVTLAHGSPRNPVWEYLLDSSAVYENFAFFDTQLCFVGHTHLPVAYQFRAETGKIDISRLRSGDCLALQVRAILNPGSAGQPRDHDPRAAYAVFDLENYTWEAHRVPYDIQGVQQRIYTAGLPHRHALRLAEGW